MLIYIQEINLIRHFFLGILHSKESCNLIGRKLRTRVLPDKGFRWYIDHKIFQFGLIPGKNNGVFQKMYKHHIWLILFIYGLKKICPKILFLPDFFQSWRSIIGFQPKLVSDGRTHRWTSMNGPFQPAKAEGQKMVC